MFGRARAPLDVAIVGCGAVVDRLYRPALRTLERRGLARVVALVDPDPARPRALARSFAAARVFGRLSDAPAVALTIVTSPPALHAEHAITAMERGSHVLCEKPMTIAPADAERMVAAAQATGRVLAVGMTRRVYPCVAEARDLIASGALGASLRFVMREGARYDWPAATPAAFRRATAAGGVLLDVGSHALDLLALLLGPLVIDTYADDGDREGVEANCRIELTAGNTSGMVQLSWNEPLAMALRVIGDAGELILDPRFVDELQWKPARGEVRRVSATRSWPSDLEADGTRLVPHSHSEAIYVQVVQALRAAALGEVPPATGADGLATVTAIADCYAHATPLRLPWLEQPEQDAIAARHWRTGTWAIA